MFDRFRKAPGGVAAGRARLRAAGTGFRSAAGSAPRCWAALALATACAAAFADDPVDRWPDPDAAVHAPPSAPAGGIGQLTVYPGLDDFLAATADLSLGFENFARGFTEFGDADDCHQAVGSQTDDACFAPGDLVPGFAIRSSRGSIFSAQGDSDIVALGQGFLGTPTKILGAYLADPPHNPTHLSFQPDVIAVAMDLYDGLTGGSISVTAYDAAQAVIGSFTVTPAQLNQPTFAGLTSPVPIDRIEINALNPGGAELLGNLRFGGHGGRLSLVGEDVDFGVVAAGATGTREVRLANDGDLVLTVPQLPAPPAPFHWTTDGGSGATLPPGDECLATLAFTPPHQGRFRRRLEWGAAQPGMPRPVLRGEAQVPALTPMPGHTHFGDVAAGSQSEIRAVQLRNLGGGDVTVLDIGVAPAPFLASGGDCAATPFVLAPGEACSLDYRFAPTAAGDFDAAVRIALDGQGVVRPGLSGRGTAAR